MTRRITLAPEGSGTGRLCVIVAAPTGVVYEVQGGGHACVPYEQEGYLIPLFVPDADSTLRDPFGPPTAEAWIPVLTPDGPGVLARENSD
ncbi:DUF6210 family protein [Streptomyces sp. 4F14]|uniref:DUF6210 family protein n=1 Tax=Streptomyces sp. 4F14 TaxID=3394380 RepID=UPI003A8A451B